MAEMYKVGTLVRHKDTPGPVGVVLSGRKNPLTLTSLNSTNPALYKVKWIPSTSAPSITPLREFWHRELEVYENE